MCYLQGAVVSQLPLLPKSQATSNSRQPQPEQPNYDVALNYPSHINTNQGSTVDDVLGESHQPIYPAPIRPLVSPFRQQPQIPHIPLFRISILSSKFISASLSQLIKQPILHNGATKITTTPHPRPHGRRWCRLLPLLRWRKPEGRREEV
jgi:hypothetical protein